MAITGHKTLAEVERYTRAAEQERLARAAIKRQSESMSGKLQRDKVANTSDELIKINSLINKVALPREARETNKLNGLGKGLGKLAPIAFQYVSASTPKPLGARAS
jgi:hypothetical protein